MRNIGSGRLGQCLSEKYKGGPDAHNRKVSAEGQKEVGGWAGGRLEAVRGGGIEPC